MEKYFQRQYKYFSCKKAIHVADVNFSVIDINGLQQRYSTALSERHKT